MNTYPQYKPGMIVRHTAEMPLEEFQSQLTADQLNAMRAYERGYACQMTKQHADSETIQRAIALMPSFGMRILPCTCGEDNCYGWAISTAGVNRTWEMDEVGARRDGNAEDS